MKQKRPFQVVITEKDKENHRTLAKECGKPYGIFFSTSGKALMEQVNPNAQYSYVYRTDKP